MKYRVNENCISCGLCEGMCPDVFSMGATGMAEAVVDEVNGDLRKSADKAMEECPVDAIEYDD